MNLDPHTAVAIVGGLLALGLLLWGVGTELWHYDDEKEGRR